MTSDLPPTIKCSNCGSDTRIGDGRGYCVACKEWTYDLPPLIKTHPSVGINSRNKLAKKIQQGTVDRLEYNRVVAFAKWAESRCKLTHTDKAEHEGVKRLYCHYMAEVERLKKELEEYKAASLLLDDSEQTLADALAEMRKHNKAMLDEGERRAMQRVKEEIMSINKVYCIEDEETVDEALMMLINRLGLSDKDNEPDFHFNISINPNKFPDEGKNDEVQP